MNPREGNDEGQCFLMYQINSTRFWACQLGFIVKAESLHSLQRQNLGMVAY